MTRPKLLRACALCVAGGVFFLGAAGCQKNASSRSAASDAGGAYGVVTPQASGGGQQGAAPSGGGGYANNSGNGGGGYSNGNGRDSGYAQPVSELAPTPPPPLPTYDQPPPPAEGDIWTPGYWAWNSSDEDYYWAPGTWVEPPREGVYWTPGYWRYLANGYGFVPGYWGPTVGFYGGVNYGWGYGGNGYEGGRWRDHHFYYNQSANNLGDRHYSGVYSEPVHSFNSDHASFNGGPRGVDMRVPAPQKGGGRGERIPPTAAQRDQVRIAAAQPGLRASVNHGAPSIVATTRPGQLHGAGVVTQVKSAPHYDAPARAQASPAAENAARLEARPNGAAPGRPAAVGAHQAGASTRPFVAPATRPNPSPTRPAAPERAAPERAAPEARSAPEPRPAPAARPAAVAPHPAPEPRPAPELHPAPQAQHVAPPMAREAPRAAAPAPHPVEAPHPVVAAPRPAAPPPHPPAPAARPAEPERKPLA